MEACESGSMFKDILPKNINVFATTAANDQESSYACYWDDDRQTYLGDVYSVRWIEDSDAIASLSTETLAKQYTVVKQKTTTSHVSEYGDMTIAKLPLSQFQGDKKAKPQFDATRVPITDAVKSQDVPVIRAQKKVQLAKNEIERQLAEQRLDEILSGREFLLTETKKLAKRLEKEFGLYPNAITLVPRLGKDLSHDCISKLYKVSLLT